VFRSGKIPESLYTSYDQQCKKMTTEILEGSLLHFFFIAASLTTTGWHKIHIPGHVASVTVNSTCCSAALHCSDVAAWGLGTAFIYLHFNGHFPGEPGLVCVYWSNGWWKWWWSCGGSDRSEPVKQKL